MSVSPGVFGRVRHCHRITWRIESRELVSYSIGGLVRRKKNELWLEALAASAERRVKQRMNDVELISCEHDEADDQAWSTRVSKTSCLTTRHHRTHKIIVAAGRNVKTRISTTGDYTPSGAHCRIKNEHQATHISRSKTRLNACVRFNATLRCWRRHEAAIVGV